MVQKKVSTRIEIDALGEVEIPKESYWGIATSRYQSLYKLSDKPIHTNLIQALVLVKKSSAQVNYDIELISDRHRQVIIQTCNELLNGEFANEIVVDAIHGASGIGLNSNINEVIANRANQLLGYDLGSYEEINPIDHINLNHTVIDGYITAMRLSILLSVDSLVNSLLELERMLRRKSLEFERVVKPSRIFLQDSVPITLGQELNAFGSAIEKSLRRIQENQNAFLEVNIGGSVVGTGYNTCPEFHERIVNQLALDSNITLKAADDYVRVSSSMSDFVCFSSSLKELSIDLVKIVNDLRVLSSGPKSGIGELESSSEMPDNSDTILSSIIEAPYTESLLMICHQVMGNDQTVTLSCQSAILESNSSTPVIIHCILDSLSLLKSAVERFSKYYLSKISANASRCKSLLENSRAIIEVLSTELGLEKAESVVKNSIAQGTDVKDFLLSNKILEEPTIDRLFSHRHMTSPKRIQKYSSSDNRPEDGA